MSILNVLFCLVSQLQQITITDFNFYLKKPYYLTIFF
nr:MAG TPA: hypothetical protein [Caudoviricetes sp.]